MVRQKTQRISYLAVMIALGVILTRVASFRVTIGGVEGIRLGIGALPLILSGIVWGPAAGFFVGALSDIIGYMITPLGAYMPHFTITSGLTGALPALLLKFTGQADRPGAGMLAAAILFGQTITSMIMVPYFLQQLFSIPWRPFFPARLISLAIHVPAYTFLIRSIVERTQLFMKVPKREE
ncbi:MAG TPA: folate family ECF transporter S component [Firmicutes bacterium]|jgi:ECF transporter S component (folate family)|nr:folate family ECF transporter S component [Bacillota bacterium]